LTNFSQLNKHQILPFLYLIATNAIAFALFLGEGLLLRQKSKSEKNGD
jgi:hypothetical protein